MILTKENLADGSVLSTLRHSCVTNLSDGRINNHDATLLIMAAANGLSTSSSATKRLRRWRKNDELAFTYLWNTSHFGGYGFVGKNINTVYNRIYNYSFNRARDFTQRRTYWYRTSRGKYSITIEGLRRLSELMRAA